MSSINSLMISCVELQYDHQYIADIFWKQHIAKVSKVTLVPYLKNNEIYNIAYIRIGEWCNNIISGNFVSRLNEPLKEVRLIYESDYWWLIEINTHNNGDINVGDYTVKFTDEYFENFTNKLLYDTEQDTDDVLEQYDIDLMESGKKAEQEFLTIKKNM